MFCLSCGKEIPDNSAHCGYCGAKQDVQGNSGPYECYADVPETPVYQPPVPPVIPTSTTTYDPNNQQKPEPKKTKTWLIILIVLLALGIFIVTAIILAKPLISKLFDKEETTSFYSTEIPTDEEIVTEIIEGTEPETEIVEEETTSLLPPVPAIKDKINFSPTPPPSNVVPETPTTRPSTPDVEDVTTKPVYDNSEELAIQAVKNDFDCFKYLTGDDLMEFCGGYDSSATPEEREFTKNLTSSLLRHFDYRILSAQKINNNTYYVYVRMTTTDCEANLNYYIDNLVAYAVELAASGTPASDAEISAKSSELLYNAFNRYDAATKQTNVTVEVVKVNGVWRVNYTEDLFNDIMGDFYKAYANYRQRITEAFEKAFSKQSS